MSSESLGTFIHRLSGVYRDPQRVLRDAETLLSSPLGTHLRPTTEPLIRNDGTSTPPVLLLRGTIPMTYRGVTYNLPIDMYLVQEYPIRPPTVFIRPVSSMAIKENHRHVGLDGRVYLPYLHEWKGNTHDLRELVVWMSSLFGSEPPCYAKPTGTAAAARPVVSNGNRNGHHHNNPPAYAQATTVSLNGGQSSSYATAQSLTASSVASSYNTATSSATTNVDEERRRAFEKEIADANMAAETARRAAAEEHRLKVEQQRLEREHEQNLLSLRTMATSKVQFEIQNLFKSLKDDLRITLKNQKQLEDGTREIEALIKEGKDRKLQLITVKDNIEKEIEKLEVWLTAVKNEQQSETNETDESNNRQCTADLIALPADTHSAQMLALSAENAAIDDCIYFLDRALVRGSIGLDVFLKEVRRLSKRQFLAKVCLYFFSVFVDLSYMYL